jgi:predicted PurR-regulated permease PerM
MTDPDPKLLPPGKSPGSPVVRGLLVVSLLGIAGYLLSPYTVPLLWAGILAFATYPLLTFLRRFVKRPVLSSLLMTGLFLSFIVLPILSFALPLTQEVLLEAARIRAFLANPQSTLPAWIDHIPFLGTRAEHWYQDFRSHTPTVSIFLDKLQTHLLAWGDKLFSIMTDAGKILVKTLIFLLGLFSFYLKGPELWRGIREILVRWAGPQIEEPFRQIGPVTRGVVYGMFFTALAQAVLAGIGFGVAHIPEALLLTFLLFFLALFPMGAVAVWLPASFTLLAQGRTLAFILFLAWNAVIVGGIENVIKPVFIGRSSEMPFILILLGVLGGLEAFGVIGLFIGPVILAILQTLWQENTRSGTQSPPVPKD